MADTTLNYFNIKEVGRLRAGALFYAIVEYKLTGKYIEVPTTIRSKLLVCDNEDQLVETIENFEKELEPQDEIKEAPWDPHLLWDIIGETEQYVAEATRVALEAMALATSDSTPEENMKRLHGEPTDKSLRDLADLCETLGLEAVGDKSWSLIKVLAVKTALQARTKNLEST